MSRESCAGGRVRQQLTSVSTAYLTVRVSDGMAIAELTLANKGPPTTTTVAFRPGAFAVLWIGERQCVCLIKRRDKFQRRYLDMMLLTKNC